MADAGQAGLLDFAGYPVGAPTTPAPAPPGPAAGGFYGLLDFTGLPVGRAGAPARRLAHTWPAERKVIPLHRVLLAQEMFRSLLDSLAKTPPRRLESVVRSRLRDRLAEDAVEISRRQAVLTGTWSVVLAEV